MQPRLDFSGADNAVGQRYGAGRWGHYENLSLMITPGVAGATAAGFKGVGKRFARGANAHSSHEAKTRRTGHRATAARLKGVGKRFARGANAHSSHEAKTR